MINEYWDHEISDICFNISNYIVNCYLYRMVYQFFKTVLVFYHSSKSISHIYSSYFWLWHGCSRRLIWWYTKCLTSLLSSVSLRCLPHRCPSSILGIRSSLLLNNMVWIYLLHWLRLMHSPTSTCTSSNSTILHSMRIFFSCRSMSSLVSRTTKTIHDLLTKRSSCFFSFFSHFLFVLFNFSLCCIIFTLNLSNITRLTSISIT